MPAQVLPLRPRPVPQPRGLGGSLAYLAELRRAMPGAAIGRILARLKEAPCRK